MGRLDGKVALITGAARGQGRSHAVRLAQEGADIIAIDICAPVRSSVADPATPDDLAETVKRVEEVGRRAIAKQADVRDFDALVETVDEGLERLGRLDIVCANAGVWTYGLSHELGEDEWQDVVDIVLTGVWKTCKATIPALIRQDQGGSIIITSSVGGIKGFAHCSHYVAAKHGTIGLMKTLAVELGAYGIRVNTVNPGVVNTALVHNAPTYELFAPDLVNPTRDQATERFATLTTLDTPWLEPEDISGMVAYLASDDARYVTGTAMLVDAGTTLK